MENVDNAGELEPYQLRTNGLEQIKIDNFKKDNPEVDFPNYIELDSHSCAVIRASISEKLGVNKSSTGLELVNAVATRTQTYTSTSCRDSDFNLKRVLSFHELTESESVFINWHRFDEIDQIPLADLTKHFDDIWYSDVDDIDIFNDKLMWILSISHFGKIDVLKF